MESYAGGRLEIRAQRGQAAVGFGELLSLGADEAAIGPMLSRMRAVLRPIFLVELLAECGRQPRAGRRRSSPASPPSPGPFLG